MILIVVLSIILNIILYAIFKNIEGVAIATLITSIVWFIIGEIDFREYRLDLKKYIYIFGILILFLICGQIPNSIVGCIVYIIITSIASFILIDDTIKIALTEGKNIITQIVKSKT